MKKITFVDLFAGIGGFHLGVKKVAKKLKIHAVCVLAVDIDKRACLTYSQNFKGTKILNDITDPVVKNSVPEDVDIICAGFPCQPFSVVGKKKGIEDHRGTLFTHIVQILHEKKPKAVFLENVRNLLNIKNGDERKLIDFIKEEMEQAGYPISIQIYKATQFGLPTHRPRVYMVGFRKDIMTKAPGVSWWPKPTHDTGVTLSEFFEKLDENWNSTDIKRFGWPNRIGNTLRVGGIESSFKNGEWRYDRRTWDAYMFFENDKDSSKRKKPHLLTVDEAKAMMGFPYDFDFSEELSFHQKMRQMGNSVAVPVIEAVALNIIKTLVEKQHG